MSVYDRVFLGYEVTKVVGTFAGITTDGLRGALAALHAQDPWHPVVCAMDAAGGRWQAVSPAEFAGRELVITLPAGIPGTPDGLAEYGQHHLPLGDRPLVFAVHDGLVLAKFAHPLGSGAYLNILIAELMRAAATGRPPQPPPVRQGRLLVTRAILRHFGRNPLRVVRMLRTPRPQPTPPAATRTVTGWRATVTTRSDRSAEGVTRQVREWRDRYAPGISLASIVFAGLVAAFGAAGLEPDPAGLVLLVDGKRYLGKRWAAGPNFIIGQYLAVPAPKDPGSIHRSLHNAIQSGRPLAAMLLRLLRQPRDIASTDARTVADPPRPTLILTFGRLDPFTDLPWSVPVERVRHTNVSSVGEPAALSVATWEFNGALHLAASFHAAVFAPEAVAGALRLFCASPVALLPDLGPAVAGEPRRETQGSDPVQDTARR
jgi:hypothetical protein